MSEYLTAGFLDSLYRKFVVPELISIAANIDMVSATIPVVGVVGTAISSNEETTAPAAGIILDGSGSFTQGTITTTPMLFAHYGFTTGIQTYDVSRYGDMAGVKAELDRRGVRACQNTISTDVIEGDGSTKRIKGFEQWCDGTQKITVASGSFTATDILTLKNKIKIPAQKVLACNSAMMVTIAGLFTNTLSWVSLGSVFTDVQDFLKAYGMYLFVNDHIDDDLVYCYAPLMYDGVYFVRTQDQPTDPLGIKHYPIDPPITANNYRYAQNNDWIGQLMVGSKYALAQLTLT